jgi:hypothetical protein
MLAVLLLFPGALFAGDREERRVWAGLDLFPSLLAADEEIAEKQGPDGKLLLLLHYADDPSAAQEMAGRLEKIGNIRKIPIQVEVTASLKDYDDTPVAGIFLTQKLSREFDGVIRYGTEHQIIVFSPFEGDVERGASGGIVVSDRILPYVNMETVRQSEIRIKSFFLRIAVAYED